MTTTGVNKIRILAVDDEEKILNMYRKILSTGEDDDVFAEVVAKANDLYGKRPEDEIKTEFELVTCQQGDDAVRQVGKSLEEEKPFSVAFVDIRMPPGPSGDRVAQQIHHLDPCVNIVIVTAFSDVSPREISSKFQIPARLFYIKKPFHWDEIYQFAVALSNNWQIYREVKDQYEILEDQLIDQTDELLHLKRNGEEDIVTNDLAIQEELKLKTQQIEEVNVALRVLLREKERDKAKTEENIAFNINEYIYPYLVKLRNTELTDAQEKIITVIEDNLVDVTSSFSSREAPKRLNFTPMELQVAKLIKHGSTSKEIADTLNLSALTINSYRRTIRKKIGLTNSKENLRSFLLENI